MDDDRNATDEPADPGAGDGITDRGPRSPADAPRRRSLFDKPLFWLGLVGVGVALAVGLSFAVERTDLSGSVGDVGHYCQQVRGVKELTSVDAVGTSADALGRAQNLVRQLTALEAVAPAPVHDDVTTVRQAAEALLAGVTNYQSSDPARRSGALAAMALAATSGQDAIGRMGEYTQEACGIDLQAPDTSQAPTQTSTPTTTR